MFLKRFCIKKSFIRQGLFLAFISSVSFNTLNAGELKECESEDDKKVGCIVKRYYENGNLIVEAPFKNGVAEGIAKSYYANGNLSREIPLKNGKREGIEKWYYENGNLSREIPYKNGVAEGIVRSYYESGNLRAEVLLKNNKIEGIVKWYYENGNIASEIPFMNSKVHGSVKFYSKKLIWQANAQNGKFINGKCTNGKTLTNTHLARINKDINEDDIGGNFWLEVCNN